MTDKSDQIKLGLAFQAVLIAINVYATFTNIAKGDIQIAGFTCACGSICFIGALVLLVELHSTLMKEKNG